MKKLTFLPKPVILILAFFLSAYSQNVEKNYVFPSSDERAIQVFGKYFSAVGLTDKKISTLFISYENNESRTYENNTTMSLKTNVDLSVSLPGKIYQKVLLTSPTNQVAFKKVLNGAEYKQFDTKYIFDGIVRDLPPNNEQIAYENDAEPRAKELKSQVFYKLFPISFDYSFFLSANKLDFKYLGMAEAPEGKAVVLEAVSALGTKYRLFFDEKSSLLLLMNIAGKNSSQKESVSQYFYSDYKVLNGVKVACKINYEVNEKPISETIIKDFKLNPAIAGDLFEVK